MKKLWSMTGFLLLFRCKIWLQHSFQSTPWTIHVSQLSLYAPGMLKYLMFFANALSSLCSCIGVALSACSDPATYSLGIFLLFLQYLTGASALWGLLCLISMQSELCFPCIIMLHEMKKTRSIGLDDWVDTRIGGEVGDKDGSKFLAWTVKWMVLPFSDLGNTNGREDCIGVGDVFSFGHVRSEEPRLHPSAGPQ